MGNGFFKGMLIGAIAGAVLLQTKCAKNIMAKGKELFKQAAESVTNGQSQSGQNN